MIWLIIGLVILLFFIATYYISTVSRVLWLKKKKAQIEAEISRHHAK